MSKDYSLAERLLMGLFGWPGVRLPKWDERIVSPVDSRERTLGGEVDWQPQNGADLLSHRRDIGRVPSSGIASGWAINYSSGERKRRISVGRPEYGENSRVEIDFPDSGWLHSGTWPATDGADDRSAGIVLPDGSCWQLWQWRVYQDVGLDAATLGFFDRRGVRVSGNGGTALQIPAASVCLTPRSLTHPHLTDFYLSEYQTHDVFGELADGQLSVGPRLGEILVLDRDSDTYRRNVKLGGACAKVAEMHATCGLLIGDRSGGVENREGLSQTPKAPALRVSASDDWRGTNIKEFQFRLTDYRYAVEQQFEFRMPDDPHTPFESEPVPDPRVALVEAAHEQFDDVIHELGLSGLNTKYLVGLNDQTMGEAVRLINEKGGRDG